MDDHVFEVVCNLGGIAAQKDGGVGLWIRVDR